MKQPLHCSDCEHSRVYRYSGWECEQPEEEEKCVDGSHYMSKADRKLTCEERRYE